MKNFVIWTVVSVALLGGIIWFSYPDGGGERIKPSAGQVVLAADNNSYNFGNIAMKDGKVSHVFKIQNNSTGDVKITKIYTSCMCTVAQIKIGDKIIGPYGMPGHGGSIPNISEIFSRGSEAELSVIFDPAAHGPAGIGTIERVVYIENDGGEPLEIKIAANVTP